MRMSIRTTAGVRRGQRHRFGAVARLSDHQEVICLLEDHPQARAHDALVVDDQDADGAQSCDDADTVDLVG